MLCEVRVISLPSVMVRAALLAWHVIVHRVKSVKLNNSNIKLMRIGGYTRRGVFQPLGDDIK